MEEMEERVARLEDKNRNLAERLNELIGAVEAICDAIDPSDKRCREDNIYMARLFIKDAKKETA